MERHSTHIEKLRERMSNQQKESVLKVLNGPPQQLERPLRFSEAINKFRLNRRITEIQRNFLKRLLMSKGWSRCGWIQESGKPSLKEKDNTAFLESLQVRERTLATFVDRTLKRSFGAFRERTTMKDKPSRREP
jgi:hypothetical protein